MKKAWICRMISRMCAHEAQPSCDSAPDLVRILITADTDEVGAPDGWDHPCLHPITVTKCMLEPVQCVTSTMIARQTKPQRCFRHKHGRRKRKQFSGVTRPYRRIRWAPTSYRQRSNKRDADSHMHPGQSRWPPRPCTRSTSEACEPIYVPKMMMPG